MYRKICYRTFCCTNSTCFSSHKSKIWKTIFRNTKTTVSYHTGMGVHSTQSSGINSKWKCNMLKLALAKRFTVISPHGHFAPSHFAQTKKSIRSIIEVTSLHTKVTLLHVTSQLYICLQDNICLTNVIRSRHVCN